MVLPGSSALDVLLSQAKDGRHDHDHHSTHAQSLERRGKLCNLCLGGVLGVIADCAEVRNQLVSPLRPLYSAQPECAAKQALEQGRSCIRVSLLSNGHPGDLVPRRQLNMACLLLLVN